MQRLSWRTAVSQKNGPSRLFTSAGQKSACIHRQQGTHTAEPLANFLDNPASFFKVLITSSDGASGSMHVPLSAMRVGKTTLQAQEMSLLLHERERITFYPKVFCDFASRPIRCQSPENIEGQRFAHLTMSGVIDDVPGGPP